MAHRIRLLPTKEQEAKLWQSAGTKRFVWNWALNKQIEHMKELGKLNKISNKVLRRELTQLKQTEEYSWLYSISNNVGKQAVKDVCAAIDRFHDESQKDGYVHRESAKKRVAKGGRALDFTDFKHFPKFKARKKSLDSFYNDTSKLKVYDDCVHLEKIGKVKLAELNKIPVDTKYLNPRITFDSKYWYISVGTERKSETIELTGESIGIDLGVKELAVVSNIDKPIKNINKTKEVRRLKKKLRRLERQTSRKYEMNKTEIKNKEERAYKFTKTKNIERIEQKKKLVHRRIANIRLNHIHQATFEIVKTKPSRIVLEDLNVKGMMKNKHLAKAIQEQCFHKFSTILEYKCQRYGIELVKANRWYPSSKTCSKCGHIHKHLKLKDRMFICPECGLKLDRDKNASINLANYVIAT
jgi:putative transposase